MGTTESYTPSYPLALMDDAFEVAAAAEREASNYYMSISHLQDCDNDSGGDDSSEEEEEECLYDESHLLEMGAVEGGQAERLLARTCIPVDNVVHDTGVAGGGGGGGAGGRLRGGLDTFLERSQTLTQTLLEREAQRGTKSFALDSDLESSDGEEELAGDGDDGNEGQVEGASLVKASLVSSDDDDDDSGSEEGDTYPPPLRRPFHSDTLDEEDEEARKSRLPFGAVDIGTLSCASCFATVARQFRAFGTHWECLDKPTSWRNNSSSSNVDGGGGERSSSGGGGKKRGGFIVEDVEEEEEVGEEEGGPDTGLTVYRNEHVAAHEVGLKDREARKLLSFKPLEGLSGKKRRFPEEEVGGVDTAAILAALSEERGPLFHPLRCSSCQCCIGGVGVGDAGRALLVAVLPCE